MSEAEFLDDWADDQLDDQQAADEAKAAESKAAAEDDAKGSRAQDRIRQLIAERDAERLRASQAEDRAQKMADLEAKVRELAEQRKAQEAKPAEPAPIPEFVEDPVGHVDAKLQRVQSEIARLEKLAADGSAKAEAEAAQAKEQLALMQFMNRVQSSEAAFLEKTPDYYNALNHARQVRVQEMEYLGMDKAEIAKAINTEEVNAAMAAIARGKDPAEFVYKRAVAAGYKPGAAPASTADPKLDAEVALYEKRRMAQSIGGGGGDEGEDLEPAGDAWAAINSAFRELYGEELR